jgi:hypothetical protein
VIEAAKENMQRAINAHSQKKIPRFAAPDYVCAVRVKRQPQYAFKTMDE